MNNRLATKKHVLLVDDEENLTQMLCMLLETRGYNVKVAYSAAEAYEQVTPEVDLIILDLVLPDENGFEVCRRFKTQETTRNIPIIMLSAQCLHKDKVAGLYLGADDFLSKPCEHEELFARMEAVMRRRHSGYLDQSNQYEDNIIFELRRIMETEELVPHFQPVFKFQPFEFYGFEILTRASTQGVLANPEAFFKAALQYGMYTELEILSWNVALNVVSKLLNKQKIFLNCNPYLIESIELERVKEIFDKNGIPLQNVILEITERSAISNFKLFYDRLRSYRDLGFRFAVDDVGGGYASLESIVETKPEMVKIDRHIISNIDADSFKQSIVKFIVSFCKENGILSIAEGIERPEELQIVKDLGVDAGQGYYLYKPTSKINLEEINKIKH